MPVYRNPPADNFEALPYVDLQDTVFLPSVITVIVINDHGARAEAHLLGWQGEDGAHVFLSPDGFACYLQDWTVEEVRA